MGKTRVPRSSGASRSARSGVAVDDLVSGQLPPQNLDAERSVLGSVLRDNACMSEVVRILTPEHFYSDHHQKMFQTMVEMYDQGRPLDYVTVADELSRRQTGEQNWLLEIGGAPTIIEIVDQTLTAANVMHYAQIVYDKAVLRSLIHASTEILRDAYNSPSAAEELCADAEKRIFGILEKRLGGDAHEVKDVITNVFTRINERHEREGGVLGGVGTGFLDLDELTNGWQDSELIILAARPSMGKTAIALNFVEHAAADLNLGVLFASLEMSELELAERLLCARAGVNGQLLRKGRLASEDMPKLIQAGEELSQAPLYIDDTPGQTMLRISATARRLKLRANLRLIVIDYLQLIEPDDRNVSRQEQISTISRRLKNLARELRVPVIALSQLNRGVETREGHRPRMSDLRESGSIEQDADVVALLHRDDAYDPQDNPGMAEVIVAKQRNGPVGEVKLTFRKELTRFFNFHQEIAPFGGDSDGF